MQSDISLSDDTPLTHYVAPALFYNNLGTCNYYSLSLCPTGQEGPWEQGFGLCVDFHVSKTKHFRQHMVGT